MAHITFYWLGSQAAVFYPGQCCACSFICFETNWSKWKGSPM